MTASDRVLFLLCVTVIVWALYQSFVQASRCRYCGKVNGHEDDCPYDI